MKNEPVKQLIKEISVAQTSKGVRDNVLEFIDQNLMSALYPYPSVNVYPWSVVLIFQRSFDKDAERKLRVEIGFDTWQWTLTVDKKVPVESEDYPTTKVLSYQGKIKNFKNTNSPNMILPEEVDREMDGEDKFITNTDGFPVWGMIGKKFVLNNDYWDGPISGYIKAGFRQGDDYFYVNMVEETDYHRHRLYEVHALTWQQRFLLDAWIEMPWFRKWYHKRYKSLAPTVKNQVAWLSSYGPELKGV